MPNVTKRNSRHVERLDNSFGKYAPNVVANPVDTFIHHTAPQNFTADRSYQDLAAALSGIMPNINGYLQKRHKEQIEKEEAKGQELYYETGGQRYSWEDARKVYDERLKEMGVSTSVRNGYLKARMANEANIFREELYNAYNSGEATVTMPDGSVVPVSESDDPAVFSLWLNRFTAQYIQDNLGKDADPEYFAKIFVPQLEKTGNEALSIHIQERNRVLEDKAIGEGNKLIANSFAKLREPDGTLTTDDERRGEAVREIQETIKNLSLSGVSISRIREDVRNLVMGLALEANDSNILFLTQDIVLGNGVSLWDTGDNALAFVRMMGQIKQNLYYDDKQRKEKEQDEANASMATLAQYIWSGQPIPIEAQQAYIEKYGVDNFSRLVSMFRNIYSGYLPHVNILGESTDRIDPYTQQERYNKRLSKALYNYIQDKVWRGEPFDLKSVIEQYPEAWSVMSNSDRKAILDMCNIDVKHKEMLKRGNEIIDRVALEALKHEGIEKGDVGHEALYTAMTANIRAQLQQVVSNPDYAQNPALFEQAVEVTASQMAAKIMAPENQEYRNALVRGDPNVPRDPDMFNAMYGAQQQAQKDAAYQSMVQGGDRSAKLFESSKHRNNPVFGDDIKPFTPQTVKQASAPAKSRNLGFEFVPDFKNPWVSSGFNRPRDGGKRKHNAIDVPAPSQTPIVMPDIGIPMTVKVASKSSPNDSRGNHVILEGKLKDGRMLECRIYHIGIEGVEVNKGDTVKAGDLIGYVGNTGNTSEGKKITPWRPGKTTGSHLHLQVLIDGKPVDPEKFLV